MRESSRSTVWKSLSITSTSTVAQGFWIMGFAILTVAGARIEIPHQPVPFTLQTLAVLLAGGFLGMRNGLLSRDNLSNNGLCRTSGLRRGEDRTGRSLGTHRRVFNGVSSRGFNQWVAGTCTKRILVEFFLIQRWSGIDLYTRYPTAQ